MRLMTFSVWITLCLVVSAQAGTLHRSVVCERVSGASAMSSYAVAPLSCRSSPLCTAERNQFSPASPQLGRLWTNVVLDNSPEASQTVGAAVGGQ